MPFDFNKWLREGEEPNYSQNFTEHPDYRNLSEPFRMMHSAKEYAWMSNEDRNTEVERNCYPGEEEFGD